MTRLLTAALLAAACSSRAPTPTGPAHPEQGSGSAVSTGNDGGAGTGGATGSAGTSPKTEAKVTRADCLATFDHVIELDMKARPPDHQLTPQQVTDLRTSMEQSMMDDCLGREPQQIACVRAAGSIDAVTACGKP